MKLKNTKSAILARSRKDNRYLFDRKMKKTILCHPVFYYLLELAKKGTDLEIWLDHLPTDRQCHIPGCGDYTRNEIEYYYHKYLMLKENGYFGEITQEENVGARMTSETVAGAIANCSQLTLEITDRCNLDCKYCGYGQFYSNYDQREMVNMDPAVAKRLIDYLSTYWDSPLNVSRGKVVYISFYGGEPLMNFPFMQEIVRYVEQLNTANNRFLFAITTNGLLLEKYMDFLVEHDFNVLISLDGDARNNGYRVFKNGLPSFDDVFKNIDTLRTKHPEFFKKRVNFNAVIHNKNSVSEIYTFFQEQFQKHARLGALNTTGIREDQQDLFWETYSNIEESLYNSEDYSRIEKEMFIVLPNIQDASLFLHRNNDFHFESYNNLLQKDAVVERFPTGTCIPFGKKVFVTVNGKILACERIGQEYALGYVDKSGVKMDFEAIARQYNSWFDDIRKQCRVCYHQDDCTQCIYHLQMDARTRKCSGFWNAEEYSGVVGAHMDFLEEKPEIYSKIFKEIIRT